MKEEQKIGFGLVLRAIAKKDDKLLLLQRPSKSSHDNGTMADGNCLEARSKKENSLMKVLEGKLKRKPALI